MSRSIKKGPFVQEAVLLKSVEVIDESGARQIIKLRDPLTLPPPERAQH